MARYLLLIILSTPVSWLSFAVLPALSGQANDDPRLAVEGSSQIFWVDGSRVAYLSPSEDFQNRANDNTAGVQNKNQPHRILRVYDTRNKEIHDHALVGKYGVVCINGEKALYEKWDQATGRSVLVAGAFGKEKENSQLGEDIKKRGITSLVGCASPDLSRLPQWPSKVVPLLEEHGFIELRYRPNSQGMIRGDDADIWLFPTETSQPIQVSGFKAIDTMNLSNGWVNWVAWKGAYFNYASEVRDSFPNRAWWMFTDGTTELVTVSRGIWNDRGGGAFKPTKAGMLIHYGDPYAELVLLKGDLSTINPTLSSPQPVVLGPVWSPVVSQNGCAVAFAQRSSNIPGGNTLVLRVVDVCNGPNQGQIQTDKREVLFLDSAKDGNLPRVKQLLDSGMDVHTRERRSPNFGRTALHYAAGGGHLSVAQILVERGADPNTKADTGYTPLHVASGLHQRTLVEFLIAKGANVNALDARGTPLMAAVSKEDEEMASLLIAKGADVNLGDNQGRRPLHIALDIEKPNLTKLLLKNDADLSLRSSEHALPLFFLAANAGYEDLVAVLHSRGIPMNIKSDDGSTLLHFAARSHKGRGDILAKALVSNGIDPNTQDKELHTPLHIAVQSGNARVVATLLALGADVNFRDKNGKMPMDITAEEHFYMHWPNHKEIVRLLIDKGADAKVRSQNGMTLLHKAASQGDLVPLLIEKGIDVNGKANDGSTPLHVVCELRGDELYSNVVRLLKYGANAQAVDNDGLTPLHRLAAQHGDRVPLKIVYTTIEALLNARADINARNKVGQTPLQVVLAAKYVNRALVEFITSKGGK